MDTIAEKVSDFINKHYDVAKKIALGEMPEVNDLRSQELFTGLRVKALAEGDVDTLRELALSETASAMATELGQRVKALDTLEPGDPVKLIRDVQKTRQEVVSKKLGKETIKSETKKEVKKIKETIKKQAKTQDWAGFIKSLEC